MRRMFFAVAMTAAMTTIGVSTVSAQESSADNSNWTVQTTGRAEMKITPDEIFMAVTLKDNDIKGQSLSQIESRFVRELKALGLNPDKDLKVNNMANAPRKRNQVDTSRSYELKVADAATLQEVFYALGDMGIKNAQVTRMSHSKIEDYRMQVRVQAMKNAQANAEALAGAVGQSISNAIYIQDNGNYYEAMPVAAYTRNSKMLFSGADMAVEESEPTLDFQDITLSYTVTAKFALKIK